jgi:hypothetical protein
VLAFIDKIFRQVYDYKVQRGQEAKTSFSGIKGDYNKPGGAGKVEICTIFVKIKRGLD